MTTPEIHKLIRQLGNRRHVMHAFETLVEQGSDAVEPLCQALNDRDHEIRWHAAMAIRRISDVRSVPLLIRALGNQDAYVRDEIARTLGKFGYPAVKPLIEVLEDRDENVRRSAAWTLERIGETRVIEPLIRGLGAMDPRVRHYSAEALGKIKNMRAIEPLIHALGDKDPHVRQIVVGALIKLGTPTIQPLIQKLGVENRDIRQDAVEVLKKVGHTDTLYRLILKETSLTPQQRFTALSALERVPDLREYCTQKLDDLHESVQLGARAVLDVSTLLIPSNHDETTTAKDELVRGAEPSISTVEPEEMLRASDTANVPPPEPPKLRGVLSRLIGR